MNFTKNIEEEKPIKIAPKKKYELVDRIEQSKFINQIRAPGGHIQITIMIDTQQQYK